MPTILCPRNREVHCCPNEELGDTIFWGYLELPATTRCAAVCKGELTFYITIVGSALRSRYEVGLEKQTCKCDLTEREWEAAESIAFGCDCDNERLKEQQDGNY